MSETTELLPAVLLALSRNDSVGFRNNTGVAWLGRGQPIRISKPTHVTLSPGDVVLRGPVHPLHAGLVKGGADVIGWTAVEITPDMVGKKVAIFTAVECKTEIGRVSQEQKNFIKNVQESGGLAGVARSVDDAIKIIKKA